MVKKNKNSSVVVEMVIDPDIEGMERLERKPNLNITVITAKEHALKIVKQCHDVTSALRNGGKVVRTLMHGELKFPDDEQDDMKGDPIWVELLNGSQKLQTRVKGSHSATFNEVFRIYIEPEDLEKGVVQARIYTTRTFGGKQLLGKCKFEIRELVPNTVMPLSLTPDENHHGMLLLQVKLTLKKEHVVPKKVGPYRKPILKELPALTIRERHNTMNARAEQRLVDLKAVLCIETNVYQDYPAVYDGLDALGRVKLINLVDMGDRMADDIFACLKGYGMLKIAMERPMDMLSLERAQHDAYRKKLGYVCAGRYETLERAQQFVGDAAPNTILVIAGKPGTGKSNIMACLHKMFAEGHRVLPNPHTKTLQLDVIAENAKAPPRGHSWARPEVVSIFMGASNGNTTPRYLLYLLMSQLAEILRVSRLKIEASTHKEKVVPADPSKMFPVPHEYNTLRLQFITLCQNIDKFVPHKRVLILIDQIDAIEGMRFDWLPVDMPKSFRLIMSCSKGNMIKKMALSTKSLKLDLLQLQPLGMRARKEMVHHLLRQRERSINMEQMDALVLHEGANMPDYLHLAVEILAGFQSEMRFAMPVIKELEETSDKVTIQVLQRMEDYCGRNLVKRCLGLILISMYGLNEYELRMILACDALSDEVSHRMKEQDEGTPAAYPYTKREERYKALSGKHALLPMSLWSPLSCMLKPSMTPSHSCQASKYEFLLKTFARTVASRYGLEDEEARVPLHKKIGSYYRARADPELKYSWRSTDYRAAQSLIYHKIGAHDWDSLTTFLTDLGFLEFCVSMGQIHGLCTDLKHTISALDSVGSREGADMQKMQDLMQLSFFMNAHSQLLLDHPSILVQVMANEPPASPVAQIALHRIQGGWEGRNWFKRLQKDVVVTANTRTMRGHKGWIRALAVTLDAKYLVSGADDKTARFWSADSGALVHLLTGHREALTAVDVSSNGLYLITSSMDASVKLWDIRSGIELANLYVGSAATSCKFSHDASLILAGTLDSTIHLFDMRTFQELYVMRSHRLGIRAIVFSKDSTRIMSGGSDGLVMMWNLVEAYEEKSGKFINAPNSTFQGHTQGVRALTWNPRNANQVVSGGDDNKIIVWNLAEENITRKLIGHSAPVLSLCFTPSGAYCISSSHDSSLIIWDPNLDEVLFRFWGHVGPVYAVVVSVDEYMAISAGADSTIRTWDVRGLLREDPDEPHMLSEAARENTLKDEKRPVVTKRQYLQYGDIYCLAYSPAGDVLLSGSQDTSYALRSIEDGETIGEPRRGHAGPVYTCQWHPDGVSIVTGSEDNLIKMWEVCCSFCACEKEKMSGSVRAGAFSACGPYAYGM
jgi:WD40 repeat protein